MMCLARTLPWRRRKRRKKKRVLTCPGAVLSVPALTMSSEIMPQCWTPEGSPLTLWIKRRDLGRFGGGGRVGPGSEYSHALPVLCGQVHRVLGLPHQHLLCSHL